MALTNGLVVMTPTSVAKTGASSTATINADGSVTFNLCDTLSLNGVFSASYDNYLIAMRSSTNSGFAYRFRLRENGIDNSTASSYTIQYLYAQSGSISAARATENYSTFLVGTSNSDSGGVAYVYGPNLTQTTALRTVNVYGTDGARFYDVGTTHNQPTSYDGFTIFHSSTNATSGLLTVFGFNQ